MTLLLVGAYVLGALALIGTLLPLLPLTVWWVRALDFPRVQLFVLGAAALALRAFAGPWGAWEAIGALAVAGALAFQALRILPFTRLWRREVRSAPGTGPRLKLLISNVLMTNREASRLLGAVRRLDPDLVVLAEPDGWWRDAVAPLRDAYPHALDACKGDTYGLLLLSRLALEDARIEHVVEPDLPSFHGFVRLGGRRVRFRFLHPKPPAPGEATHTTDRDAELVLVGKACGTEQDVPTVVAGDLNDVAWSDTTRLFQKVSRLLDPRRGRGLYATFHAAYPFLRWPLDHVFHSDHFTLVRLARLPGVGSDHFPVFIELELTPGAEHAQEAPAADADDHAEAAEKVAAASDPAAP